MGNNEIAKLQGQVEGLKFIQIALLAALGSQNLDLRGIARDARQWARVSKLDGEAQAALELQLEEMDALAATPPR